jgi:hypothetical protein
VSDSETTVMSEWRATRKKCKKRQQQARAYSSYEVYSSSEVRLMCEIKCQTKDSS